MFPSVCVFAVSHCSRVRTCLWEVSELPVVADFLPEGPIRVCSAIERLVTWGSLTTNPGWARSLAVALPHGASEAPLLCEDFLPSSSPLCCSAGEPDTRVVFRPSFSVGSGPRELSAEQPFHSSCPFLSPVRGLCLSAAALGLDSRPALRVTRCCHVPSGSHMDSPQLHGCLAFPSTYSCCPRALVVLALQCCQVCVCVCFIWLF